MINSLFPKQASNAYPGHRLAIGIFVLVVLMRTGIALGSIFNGYNAASSADGIPINTFSADASNLVVSLFGLLGLANLVISTICVVVLFRYRNLIPLMFMMLLVYQAGRKVVLYYLPIERVGTPPGNTINVVILGAMITGLVLSLWRKGAQIEEGR